MKNIISKLNKAFESRIRLGIMSILSVNDSADFNTMKQLMDLTDGNPYPGSLFADYGAEVLTATWQAT